MKKLIASSLASAAVYYATASSWKAILTGGTTYFFYEPDYVPTDADNFPLMYLFMLLRRRKSTIDKCLISLGIRYKDELDRRRKLSSIKTKLCPNCSEESIRIVNFNLYKFTPNSVKSNKAIIYFHGGGFVISDIPFYRRFVSNLAVNQNCLVFAPDYRKAPENPFPASELDCLDAVKYIFENAKLFGIDPQKIIFTGDSAGGMLAVNMWYRLHLGSTLYSPCAISLLYPCLGYRSDGPSFLRNSNYPPLTREVCSFFYLCLMGETHDQFKYNMLRDNLHLDYKNIPQEQRELADPEKWLPSSELSNWKKIDSDALQSSKVFSTEEVEFRERVLKLVKSPNYSLLFIPDEVLCHIPPTDIFVSEHDILKNDGQILAARLQSLNRSCRLKIMNGAFHANLIMSKQFGLVNLFHRTSRYCDDYFDSLSIHGK